MIIIQDLDSSVNTHIEDEFETTDIDQTSIFKSLRYLITPLLLNNKIQEELLESKIIDEKLKIDNGEGTFELFYGINFIKNQIKGTIDFIPIEPSSILDHFDYRIYGKVFEDGRVASKYLCQRFDNDPDDRIIEIESKFT